MKTRTRQLPPRVILGVECPAPWLMTGNGKDAIFMSRAGLDAWLARYGGEETEAEAEQLEMDLAA